MLIPFTARNLAEALLTTHYCVCNQSLRSNHYQQYFKELPLDNYAPFLRRGIEPIKS